VIAALSPASAARATNYSLNTPGAFFDDASRWTPAGVPSTADTAALGLDSTYTEYFETSPTIQNLNVLRGNVSFVSLINPAVGSFGAQTLTVTGIVSLPNANGNTSLTLGSSGAIPLTLSTSNLSVQGGAVLVAQYASQITVGGYFITGYDPVVSSIFNGLVIVGGGSKITVGATWSTPGGGDVNAYRLQQFVGTSGGTGELLLENGASGNYSTLSDLLLADDGTSANGSVALVSGSTLGLTGNIKLATDGSASTPTALLEINSANSALTQSDYYGSLGLALRTGIYAGSNGNGSATINISQVVSGGTLTTGTAGLTINKTGTVNVGSSTSTGTLNANGDVTINGGALHVDAGSFFNLASGQILMINGGTAQFKSYTPNASQLTFIAGSLSYVGNCLIGTSGLLGTNVTLDSTRQLTLTGTTTIDPSRTLLLSGGALHTGSLLNNGTLSLNSGTFNTGTATLASGSTLSIAIGGPTRFTLYGALVASGAVSLNGSLVVTLNNFTPALGSSFDILDGNLSGAFTHLQLPGLSAGLGWNTSSLYTTGVLSVVTAAGIPGDYNGNGVVDAADYVVWRKGLATTYVQADYNVWRAHFGQPPGSGAGTITTSAVPEPTTLVMVILVVLAMCSLHRADAS
jgi:hypothetical protein